MFDDEGSTGAGVHCKLSSCYAPVGAHSAYYNSEIDAVYIALKQLSIRLLSLCQVFIFFNSQSALQSTGNTQHSNNIHI